MASRVTRRLFTTTVRRFQEHEKQELKKETKRNPETLVRHNGSRAKQLPAKAHNKETQY